MADHRHRPVSRRWSTGAITWIVDGYTTLPNYPYAEQWRSASATDRCAERRAAGGRTQAISYLRNSVKATVDAYDGNVTLYAFDDSDPVLQTWMKAFPGIVQPGIGDQPEPAVALPVPGGPVQGAARAAHPLPRGQPGRVLRRRVVLGRPVRPDRAGRGGAGAAQPPYYLLAGAPGASRRGPADLPAHQRAGVQQNRDILSAYVTASSDPAIYGKITVLQLPSGHADARPAAGAVAVHRLARPSAPTSACSRGRTRRTVEYGNLLTLPVAGGLLYVEPIYIERSRPGVQLSTAGQGARLQRQPRRLRADAWSRRWTRCSARVRATAPRARGRPRRPSPTPHRPRAAPSASPQVQAAATAIQTAIGQLKAAQTSGDFAAQGQALAALDAAVKQFQAAQSAAGGGG